MSNSDWMVPLDSTLFEELNCSTPSIPSLLPFYLLLLLMLCLLLQLRSQIRTLGSNLW